MMARPPASPEIIPSPMPAELIDGVCREDFAYEIVDSYIDKPNTSTEYSMRRLCERCPVATRKACFTWVTSSEPYPGAWPGMYAGLTRKQREQRR